MKSRQLIYLPLIVLFILSAVAFVQHSRRVANSLSRIIYQSESVRFPFELKEGIIQHALPEAAAAGIRPGDRIMRIGGVLLTDDETMVAAINKAKVGEKLTYTVQRTDENGKTENLDFEAETVGLSMTARQVATDFSTTFLFLLCLPALSYALGFYVAFLRPYDRLAWILLLMLLGIGSIALESGREGTYTKVFQETALNFVGVWMVLFGVYFPERLPFDKRFPWAKWVLITPLIIGGFFNLLEQLGRFFGWTSLWEPIDNATKPFDKWMTVLNMIAIGVFFASMATKSAILENPNSRRRLRILYFGTSIAMLPALVIVLYRVISGKTGGFFELVPGWFAITALMAMLLFPLTMAYVIVVQQAMDVSVVIRQGLQYALARSGVRILQFILLIAVVLVTVSIVRNFGENLPAQIGFVACGLALIPVIEYFAKNLGVWIDKRFFRETYNAEQILADLSEDVRTMVETQPLLETVAGKISESLHVPQVSVLLNKDGQYVPAHSIGYDTKPVVALSGDSKSIRKLGRNQHIVLYDDMTEVTATPTMSFNDMEQLRELNSQVLLPVAAKNNLSGIISLSPKLSEQPYTPTDLRLLRSVAAQMGIALENSRLTEAVAAEAAQKERLNTELEIAREVQERLFPQELPRVAGLDFYGACRPALGVGGDYYDFLELRGGKLGIAIGDISGKGIGASLMMASLQASLRGQAIHFGDELAELMKQINELVYEASTSNRYATFFYSQFDPKTRTLTYVNGGHNPPFLLRRDGSVEKLETGGPVVGMLPAMIVDYEQADVQLEPGDMLVGFTDGISEAMNPAEEEWGEDALLDCLKTITDRPSKEILEICVKAADKFANGAKQHDDMTMIVVKVLEDTP